MRSASASAARHWGYDSSDVRGFSPIDAGNARIDGLYFDPVSSPTTRIGSASLSTLVAIDGYGGVSPEADAALPLSGATLILGIGGDVTHSEESDGTDGSSHGQGGIPALAAVGRAGGPALLATIAGCRLRNWADRYPAGATLPPKVRQRRFDGPAWAGYRGDGFAWGVAANPTGAVPFVFLAAR